MSSPDRVSGRPSSPRGQVALVLAYARLEIVRSVRSRQYLLLAVIVPAGLYAVFLLASIGGPGDPAVVDATRSTSTLGALATLGALGAGLACGGSRLAAERDSGWVRTLMLGSLPRSQLVAGRVLAGVITAGLAILVVIGAGGILDGGRLAPGSWPGMILSLWIGTLPFAMLGVLVGLSLGPRAAAAAVLALYVGLAVGGGLLEPIGWLPIGLATIGRVLPSFVVDDLGWRALLGQGLSAHDLTLLAAESLALGSLLAWNRRPA